MDESTRQILRACDHMDRTKEEILKRVQIKVRQHEIELDFYRKALVKIKPLVEGTFYEITYRPQHAGITKEKTLLFYAQLIKIGVDRALFKLFTCDTPRSEISLNLFTVADTELSILWGWDWDVKPADEPATYIAWPWKNKAYEKLLKGKRHGPKDSLGQGRSRS